MREQTFELLNTSDKLIKCLHCLFGRKRFPFDIHNPTGYLIAIIFEDVIFSYEFYVIACTLALGIGIFGLSVSVTSDFQHVLLSINEKTHINEHRSNEVRILFVEFIVAHAAIKQLS